MIKSQVIVSIVKTLDKECESNEEQYPADDEHFAALVRAMLARQHEQKTAQADDKTNRYRQKRE
jgi:hypothetical protein